MRKNTVPLLVSRDKGLLKHWREALRIKSTKELGSFKELLAVVDRDRTVVWLDLSIGDVPAWSSSDWDLLLRVKKLKIVAASSHPKDMEAIAALDSGCAGYCHAFSDLQTIRQIHQVISAGHVWIGQHLMQQLIQSANRVKPDSRPNDSAWNTSLTTREYEVAKLAAHGATNLLIAEQCGITERTVKAHLSAVFEKLGIADRLQLALKVHGIQ